MYFNIVLLICSQILLEQKWPYQKRVNRKGTVFRIWENCAEIPTQFLTPTHSPLVFLAQYSSEHTVAMCDLVVIQNSHSSSMHTPQHTLALPHMYEVSCMYNTYTYTLYYSLYSV